MKRHDTLSRIAQTATALVLAVALSFWTVPLAAYADVLAAGDDAALADADATDAAGETEVQALESAEDAADDDTDASDDETADAEATVAAEATGDGSVELVLADGSQGTSVAAEAGETVTIVPEPAEGSYLAQVRWGVPVADDEDADTDDDEDADADDEDADADVTYAYTAIDIDEDGAYSFTMPDASDVQVRCDFVSIVWDGTIDVTWYDPDATEFTLRYAAQFEGAAAIVNGIFTTYPTSTSGSHELPNYDLYKAGMGVVEETTTDEDGEEVTTTLSSELYGEFTATYYLNDSQSDYTRVGPITATARVIGDPDAIVAVCSTGSTGSYNQVSTNDYWIGAEDFAGKTIYIAADLDFGATLDEDGLWDTASPLFMSIGGQYAMLPGDEDGTNGYSKLSSSFNGVLDGNGHSFSNVYAERYANTAYGDSSTLGIVGRLGNHDNDSEDIAAVDPTVREVVLESGLMSARRSVGGIVGKIGQTTASLRLDDSTGGIVEYCINKADIVSTDSKGVGGIVGASWNAGVVHDCANFGSVTSTYSSNPAGGIVGSNEIPVYNCYSVGTITTPKASYAMGIGTNNGGGSDVDNCYWLTGTAAGGGYYGSNTGTVTEFGSGCDVETLTAEMLNADTGTVWFEDDTGINELDDVNYPVLWYQFETDDESSYTVTVEQPDEGGTLSVSLLVGGYGTTVRLSCSPDAGYVLDYYTLDGVALSGSAFSLDGDHTVSAVFRAARTATVSIATYDDYTLSVTKDGVASVDGQLAYVADWPVSDGDTLYEGDVLSYTATLVEGAAPDVAYLEYNGVFNFQTTDASGTVTTSDSYTVTGEEETLAVTVSFAGTQQKLWSSLADTSFYDADDVAAEYVITTPEQLAGLSVLVSGGESFEGVTFTLGCDISLANPDGSGQTRLWSPIGAQVYESGYVAYAFSGTFDGAGYSITDMSLAATGSYQGLFGITDGATIRNVSVAGELALDAYSGAIVGMACNTAVEGCTSTAAITSQASSIGGIVGCIVDDGEGEASSVVGCVFAGEVSGRVDVGGIVGNAAGASEEALVAVQGCENAGSVSFGSGVSASGGAGGIVGNATHVALSQCANSGSVAGADAGYGSAAYVGGLVGYAATGTTTLEQCANAGAVAGEAYAAGGVLGYARGTVTCTDCYNVAAIENASYDAGGIVGYTNNNATTSVANAYSAGAVSGTTAGAIAGTTRGLVTFANVHYLTGSASSAIGASSKASSGSSLATSAQSASALAELAGTLGEEDVWHADALSLNGGYPMLAWQTPYVLSYLADDGSELLVVWMPAGCTLSNDEIAALYGEEPASEKAGYTATFAGWMAQQGGSEAASVEDAAGDVDVWACFTYALVTYAITYELAGGTLAGDAPTSYTVESADIALPEATREGYTFGGWVDESGASVSTIAAGSTGDVALTATWTAEGGSETGDDDGDDGGGDDGSSSSSFVFTDVVEGSWYEEAVYVLFDAGYVNGYTDDAGELTGIFGVGDSMTRAQLATIIWRIAQPQDYAAYQADYAANGNVYDCANTSGLTDVTDDRYYTAAVNWAVSEGVITGYTSGKYAGKFRPNVSISFQDMCLVIARYAGGEDGSYAAITTSQATSTLKGFKDASKVSSYARAGMAWCVTAGLVSGYTYSSGLYLKPAETVARERVVTVIYRGLDLLVPSA